MQTLPTSSTLNKSFIHSFMLYTYILDDSIKSPTLILTADHSTLLFLPSFFYQIQNFLFFLWVSLYMVTGIYSHDPPPFNGPFSGPPPPHFSESQKVVTLPLFPPPPPLLISDKFLTGAHQQRRKNRNTCILECHYAKASSTKNVILNQSNNLHFSEGVNPSFSSKL